MWYIASIRNVRSVFVALAAPASGPGLLLVNPGAIEREAVRPEGAHVRDVDRDVGEAVGRPRHTGGVDARRHAVRSDREVVLTPHVGQRDPPVGRGAADHTGGSGVERARHTERCRAVNADFAVDAIIPHRVGRQSGGLLRERAIHESAAAGVGATAELPYGKPQAGVLFQTSCTVGLLLRLTPSVVRFARMWVCVAKRKSALSTPS